VEGPGFLTDNAETESSDLGFAGGSTCYEGPYLAIVLKAADGEIGSLRKSGKQAPGQMNRFIKSAEPTSDWIAFARRKA
jgi:hypothetical protein